MKVDHFEAIYRLKKEVEGVPNFRKVDGYLIFGSGQPTVSGLATVLDKIKQENGVGAIRWFNMRQEPVIYVNEVRLSVSHWLFVVDISAPICFFFFFFHLLFLFLYVFPFFS
jgi:hypothetical protein